MTQRRQAMEQVLRCGALDVDAPPAFPLPARGVERCLRIQAKVDRVHDHLHMALRLHEAAHHAKRPNRRPVLGQKAGDDGVIGPFAGRQTVGVGGIEREIVATVVQADAGAGHHQTGTKAHVVALDQ